MGKRERGGKVRLFFCKEIERWIETYEGME
jgi:hypothetical protein